MSTNSPEKQPHSPPPKVEVPRDSHLDTGGGPTMPSPERHNIRDEDYARRDKPALPDSATAKALQAHPPRGKGQLGVGTAGDAARPSEEGIHHKPVPPRGRL